ncbi:ribose transport system permease protein [Deinococcus metalli]|uniref:Ribose ABC transporter permease n=1 Tax=Deinococcus metalli TaxID=1141878 RepID=A0A7W8KE12_9DEIO|nr:ABC transporter permease [Deinococcus metalli]MBB5376452.1 ribose transport system permease protein [Deinococcus metalli]GHF43932.1 ribose ABC transporter permease [Deinococcus metalli]
MQESKRAPALRVTHFTRRYGTAVAALAIVAVFSVLSPDAFFSVENALNITRQISFLVIIAIAATFVMVVGEFDLSVGALASLGGVVAAQLAVAGMPVAACFAAAAAAGVVTGVVNGWLITRFGLLSFITTLAMGTVLGGLVFWMTGGSTVFENIPDAFSALGRAAVLGVPALSLVMLAVAVLAWFVLTHTPFGRRLYAVGGNRAAARVAGISVGTHTVAAFAVSGLLAAFTGALLASRLGSAQPTGGNGLFLPAYAAAFLGMTAFKDGVPNVPGTVLGALIIGVLANGLTILQIPTFLQDVITGLIVILAVIVQRLGAGRGER